jgi:Protein kinase domain
MNAENSDASFGGWVPGEELHASANARVYRATRGEEAAVLKVCASWNPAKPTYRRFLREIEVLGSLVDDPGVMPLLDSDVPAPPAKGRFPWYVMPEGITFVVAFAEATPGDIVRAVSSIAATISRLHQRDLHHRDVKPANLFRLGDGSDVVGDLGLVGQPTGLDPTVTQPGEKLGPANFIAPEMLEVDPDKVDARFADVYSLAKVLWTLVSRRTYPLPGPQRAADPTSLAAQTSDGDLADIDRLIERATSNDPSGRPSMNEMAGDLALWIERHESRADAEAVDLDQAIASARARLAGQYDQQRVLERHEEEAEAAMESLLEGLEPLYAAMENVGTTSNLNDSDHLIASALYWADQETIGGSRILNKWEALAHAQAGSEPNAVRLHLAVRLILFEGGSVSFGIGIDVTSWPMAAGTSRFHWREIEEDIPVESILLKERIRQLLATALAKSPEAIDTFSRMGQQLG